MTLVLSHTEGQRMTRTIDIPTLIPEQRKDRDFVSDLEAIRRDLNTAVASTTTVRTRKEGGAIIIGLEPAAPVIRKT